MEILKAFVFNDTKYNVTIVNDGEPLFKADDIGKILCLKNVRSSIKKYDEDKKRILNVKTSGGMQDVIFLTDKGVFRLLYSSRKKVAQAFIEWSLNVMKEINYTGEYKVTSFEKEYENTLTQIAEREKEKATHTTLSEAYHKKDVVYFGYIKDIGDKQLIKVGCTGDLKNQRIPSLTKQFGSMRIFYVIECDDNEGLETYLKEHKYLCKRQYKNPINALGDVSSEVFLVTQEEKEKILRIAKRNVHKFKERKTKSLKENIEEMKNSIQLLTETIKLQQKQIQLLIESNTEMKSPVHKEIIFKDRIYTHSGPKIQVYTPDGKKLIKTYESYIEAERDPNINSATRPQIKRAIKEKTIYKNYRWAKLDRNLQSNTHQNIGKTHDTKNTNVNNGLVAMLNLKKDKIIAVFPNQKEAAQNRGFKSGASISKAIRMESKSGGHYYKIWFDCDDKLKNEFLKYNDLPKSKSSPNAKIIQRIDEHGNITTYKSMAEVKRIYHVGHKKVEDAIKHGFLLKGYHWKYE